MATIKQKMENGKFGMKAPPGVSPQEWQVARQHLLVKEGLGPAPVRAWPPSVDGFRLISVEKKSSSRTQGKVSLLVCFWAASVIVYRAFFEPGVFRLARATPSAAAPWGRQVAHLAQSEARDTARLRLTRRSRRTNRAPKARMGWRCTVQPSPTASMWTSSSTMARPQCIHPRGERVFRTYFTQGRGARAMGNTV